MKALSVLATGCISVLVVLPVVLEATQYFTELETLNPTQKAALKKLKDSASTYVPHAYMKEDIFLVKFLQVSNYNARKGEELLKESLKFRKEAKVDQWGDASFWKDFEEKDYPAYQDGFDRTGRPVSEAYYGEWNVRAAAVAGKIKHLTNYALRGLAGAHKQIRELQAKGSNVTQSILLLNMEGFNLITQACPTCLPMYLGFVSQGEKVWPGSVYRIILVNTPESFEVVLNLIKPLMSPQSRAALKIFGTNKAEWKPYVDNLIDPTQVSDWFDPKGKERKLH